MDSGKKQQGQKKSKKKQTSENSKKNKAKRTAKEPNPTAKLDNDERSRKEFETNFQRIGDNYSSILTTTQNETFQSNSFKLLGTNDCSSAKQTVFEMLKNFKATEEMSLTAMQEEEKK